jgi:hypothetical protein
MTMRLFVAALAVLFWMPHASGQSIAGQSIVQRSDWQDRGLETYLPSTVPWLDLNTRTKLPKGDLPLGREAASAGRFFPPFTRADTQVPTIPVPTAPTPTIPASANAAASSGSI